MNEPGKEKKAPLMTSMNMTAAGLAGQLGLFIPGIIVASVLGGVWLDKTFNTSNHVFVILLLLASLPLSIFLTFKMAMRAVKNINEAIQPSTSAQKSQPKEDETGDK